jgi:hypothetical protein
MEPNAPSDIKLLHAADVPALCATDVAALREQMSIPSPNGRTKIALQPDYKTHEWHWAREEFLAPILRPKISRKPVVKGAMSSDGKRWVLWTRNFNKNNTQLSILRIVNHSQSPDEEKETAELAKLLRVAAQEAHDWKLETVTIWNPTELTVRAAKSFAAESAKFVERDTSSICCVMMHDQGSSTEDVEWVANEKFEWC